MYEQIFSALLSYALVTSKTNADTNILQLKYCTLRGRIKAKECFIYHIMIIIYFIYREMKESTYYYF